MVGKTWGPPPHRTTNLGRSLTVWRKPRSNFIDTANKSDGSEARTCSANSLNPIATTSSSPPNTRSTTLRRATPTRGVIAARTWSAPWRPASSGLSPDYIDLYWVHAWDFMTPVEEVMRQLGGLIQPRRNAAVWACPTRWRGVCRRPTRSPKSTAGARSLDPRIGVWPCTARPGA